MYILYLLVAKGLLSCLSGISTNNWDINWTNLIILETLYVPCYIPYLNNLIFSYQSNERILTLWLSWLKYERKCWSLSLNSLNSQSETCAWKIFFLRSDAGAPEDGAVKESSGEGQSIGLVASGLLWFSLTGNAERKHFRIISGCAS